MIITRLTMKNFGVYAGVNTFEFSHSRPVVLIGGMNGRGKTTFLEAILLSLYGDNSMAFRESRFRSYGQFLRAHVNKNHIAESTYIELEFLMNEKCSETYLVHREWNAVDKKTEETIIVKENGVANAFLAKNWAMFVENILPSALSSFYFFDGEKIAELAVDNTNTQVKNSIRSMLGIGTLDVLKNDLNRSIRRISKESSVSGDALIINELRTERDRLEHQLQEIEASLLSLSETIQKKRDQINSLHHRYASKGGDVIEQRRSLMQKRSDLQVSITQNDAALVELAAGALPLILIKNLIADIKLQAEDEHNDYIIAQALFQFEDYLTDYEADHNAPALSARDFIDYIRTKSENNASDPVYSLSDHAIFQVNSLLESVLDESRSNTLRLLEQKKSLQKDLDTTHSHLSLDIHENEITKLFEQIKVQEHELISLEVQQGKLEQDRISLASELNNKKSELNRVVEDYLSGEESADDSSRMSKYLTMALSLTESYTVALQKRKTDVLGETITDCYKQLANKKNLIETITMDPETLDLQYLDKNGDTVLKDSLSAGEKQLMVIAILWALAICSKKKLPVIIDTPLSRLDSMHRTSLVTTYFPNASDQTIILSTDSEIDHNYYEMMKDSIGDEFTLSYNEDTRSTSILKGYFQKP